MNIEKFREMVTDFLAGELGSEECDKLDHLKKSDATFMDEFRLMEEAWGKADGADIKRPVPSMSDRLKAALCGGELDDDELDMVSGGIKSEIETDPEDYNP